MTKTSAWKDIDLDELPQQSPFSAEGRRYRSQTNLSQVPTKKRIGAIFIINFVLSLFFLPFLFSIGEVWWSDDVTWADVFNHNTNIGPLLGMLVGLVLGFALNKHMIRNALYHHRVKKRLRHFAPHTLYTNSPTLQRGTPLQATYQLKSLRARIGEEVVVTARILCEEGLIITRGTSTQLQRDIHWQTELPPQRFNAQNAEIYYDIDTIILPDNLPPALKGTQHWVQWCVHIRLQFPNLKPIYVPFQLDVR